MDATIFIARLLGVIYLAVGAGLLASRGFYERLFNEFKTNTVGIYLGGLMALATGVSILSFHNDWELTPGLAITVIGWLAIAKGVSLVIMPEFTVSIYRRVSLVWAWAFAAALGSYFIWLGFVYPNL